MSQPPDTLDPDLLLAALDHALADLQDMTDQRDALHAHLARTRPPAPTTSPDVDLAEVATWVDTWLRTHLEVQLGARNRWCRQWPEHPAAVLYLTQMYADYNRALADPKLGIAAFLRNSLHYYRAYLLAPDGPFASCDPHRHEPPIQLPTTQRGAA